MTAQTELLEAAREVLRAVPYGFPWCWRLRQAIESVEKATIIMVFCGWCGVVMGEKDGRGQSGVSHGICEECSEKCAIT